MLNYVCAVSVYGYTCLYTHEQKLSTKSLQKSNWRMTIHLHCPLDLESSRRHVSGNSCEGVSRLLHTERIIGGTVVWGRV